MTAFTRQPITSAGLLLAVISALIAMAAAGRPLVSGSGRVAGSHLAIDLPGQTALVFAIAAVVLAVSLTIRPLWAKLVGVAVAFGLAGTQALMVAIAKTSTRFRHGATPHLESGGQILAIAFIAAILGVVVIITGARELLPGPATTIIGGGASGVPVRPGSSLVALGFSLLGVIFFPAAPVGVVLGLLSYWQITRAHEHLPGRNLALAAVILGTTWISLWTILVFGSGIWSAPTV